MIVSRSYQKLIDAFAYVGGLLGAILILLIVFKFYNEYHYEISFAQSITKPQEDSPATF